MKKYSWILALLLALTMAFVVTGCKHSSGDDDDDDDDDTLVDTVVFDMATDAGIQALAIGKVTFSAEPGADNPIKPLVKSGETEETKSASGGVVHISDFQAVAGPGTQKVALQYTTAATWGVGLDLRYAAFGFREGDKVTVTGEVKSGGPGKVQLNDTIGNENAIAGGNTPVGPFSMEVTLTAAHITHIKAGDPSGIRIEARVSGMTLVINNITITGKRPAEIKALAAPVATATETGVSWTAVEGAGGYKVNVGANVVTVGPVTELNIALNETIPDGTYEVTVIALGVSGVSTDSPKSNAVSFTKYTVPPPQFNIKVGGTEKAVEIYSRNVEIELLDDENGYIINKISGGYEGAYAWFYLDFGTDKLSDYEKVTFTYSPVSGSDLNYKQIGLIAATETFPAGSYLPKTNINSIANQPWYNSYNGNWSVLGPQIATPDVGDEVEFTLWIDRDATITAESKLYLTIYADMNAGSCYSISDIEFVKGSGAGAARTYEGITVGTAPNKGKIATPYDQGDAPDLTGLVIYKTYKYSSEAVGLYPDSSVGIEYDEDTFSFSPATLSASGNEIPITVTYDSKTTTFNVVVMPSGYVPPTLADGVFQLGAFDDGVKTWVTNGVDDKENDLTEEIFAAAKYLVLNVTSPANSNGFGGIQMALQGNGNSWGWAQYNVSGDWNQPSWVEYNDAYDFYVVIDLASMEKWNDVSTGGGAKLILNVLPPQLSFNTAYLVSFEMTPSSDSYSAAGGSCWAVKIEDYEDVLFE